MTMLAETLPTRVNLGCGFDIRPGYLNVDMHEFHKPDLIANVSKLDMLPSDYFEEVVAQDVLEHMPRTVAREALKEWARITRPGGRLVVRVPSLIDTLQLLLNRPRTAEAQGEIEYLLYGTQAYEGDFHLSGYTAPMLAQCGRDVGLVIAYARMVDGWVIEVTFRKLDQAALSDEEFVHSTFVDALGRVADDGAVAAFAPQLRAGAVTRIGLAAVLIAAEKAAFEQAAPQPPPAKVRRWWRRLLPRAVLRELGV